MSALYPLRLTPCYQSYLWGGDKIIRTYKRQAPPGIYAESWEVSDRAEGMSVVANGAWAGKALADVVAALGRDLLGRRASTNRFPLLIKLIDAKQTLSVQVHPDNASAARWGGEPKTEMWYALQADPGAFIYSGTIPGTTEAAFRRAVETGQVETLLRRIPVQAGQRYYIPGGRMHAIGAGCLLLEVQQNSNTTYRVYDWGRKGPDGKPRPLHLEEAMRVTDWKAETEPRAETSPFFQLMELNIAFEQTFSPAGESFHVLFVAEGLVRLNGEDWPAGSTAVIPAALPEYTIYPINGPVKVLRIQLPG